MKEKIKARKTCFDCGRKIIILYHGRAYLPSDNQHDLCRRCWKRAGDRLRNQKIEDRVDA